ncbi:Branched-chain amino acid transport ATP-binding protein LivF [Paramagnetospirillum magnetotacticum MS-1]|uniref:Branched-chain amino acid transport ATP-binding protein LivF n=1 Tax=Paramagnetospirillum magnetotacticum MS-1 TaxID=272627 RepID=A0A0C2YGH2_PARME|nr:ABC transporter ATP-binding protein [Paramagnetospirillum magnetotacticum]KIL98864.1 Branched-chain amino acid transport ATP-binding protein LivF [Paramagnetospirillum magnetotacticum MS-1]
MLEIRDLDLFYGDAQALAGVSFTVPDGSITAIVGANGAGKTSLIRAIAGMEKPRSGSIVFDGHDITAKESFEICDLGLGQVAEGRQVFPTMSVQDNLELGAMVPRARAKAVQSLDRVWEMFPRLLERRKQLAGTLSGGEQQMLAIGRCLMGLPKMIMFDEPSLGLSPAMVQEVFAIIRRLHEADGMTVVLVEQNVAVSLHMADHACVLENGHVVMEGRGADLLGDDGVRAAYLGL